jgi:hypothetical protein
MLRECNGYDMLFYFLNAYSDTLHKPLIAVVLARFYLWVPLPTKHVGVLVVLREVLRIKMGGKIPLECDVEMNDMIKGVLNISVNEENKEYFFLLNFLPLIYDLIYKYTGWIKADCLAVLNNISNIRSLDRKRDVVDGAMNTFLRTLDIPASSLYNHLPTSNAVCTQMYCLNCLCNLTYMEGWYCTAVIDDLARGGVFPKVNGMIAGHQAQLKKNDVGLCFPLLRLMFGFYLNVALDGSFRSKRGEANKRRALLTDSLEQLIIEIHRSSVPKSNTLIYPSSPVAPPKLDSDELDVMNLISIVLILFHNGVPCPPHLLSHLSSVHSTVSQPPGAINLPRWAKVAYDGIPNADIALDKI